MTIYFSFLMVYSGYQQAEMMQPDQNCRNHIRRGTKMKKIFALLTVVCMILCLLSGCGSKAETPASTTAPAATTAPATEAPTETPTEAAKEPVELIIFAAASMTETLTKLGEQYMVDYPEVTVVFNFDSSGTLKTQIQEGADCDIFISAGQKQMNQLDLSLIHI